MKSSEIRVQQKINESKNTNSDKTPAAKIEGIEVSTTIKFKDVLSCMSMSPTIDNKCWLLVTPILLFLLNDSKVITKVDIPYQYRSVFKSNIRTNDKGEAVYISGQSVIAVKQDGTFYKLFDFPFLSPSQRLCFLHSGNYIIVHQVPHFGPVSIHEYSRDGVHLRTVTTGITPYYFDYDIRQNHNGDVVAFNSRHNFIGFPVERHLLIHILAADDFHIKHRVSLPEPGVVVPCMNSRSDLLFGHGKTIDLLTSSVQMVKTVYTTSRDTEIRNIASSGDGTVWILYDSDEVEIIKLEI